MRPTKTANRVLGVAAGTLDATVRKLDHARRIAKFLRGSLEFEACPDDVFISSYPRSGTTLTQWILYLLSHAEQPDPPHLTRASPWFERSLAIGELTVEDLKAFRSPRVFKSHLPREWLPEGGNYIYVEREVADVVISYFHFYRAYLGFKGTLADFHERFVRGRLQYGSWFEHVASWRAHAFDPNVLILRYEDLLADRRGSVERIVEFLGWTCDEATLDRAVEQSSFEAMKQREALFDHATALLLERGVTPRSFLRAGKTGHGAGALNEAQLQALRETGATGRRLAIRGLASFLQ